MQVDDQGIGGTAHALGDLSLGIEWGIGARVEDGGIGFEGEAGAWREY